jgi:hypothetical protein
MTTRGGVDFLESYVHMVVVFQPNGANSLFCTNQECDYQVLNFLSEIHIYMIYEVRKPAVGWSIFIYFTNAVLRLP